MTTLSLKTASDEAINAAVAEHCADAYLVVQHENCTTVYWDEESEYNYDSEICPDYLHNANAVIELLQKAENVEIKLTRMPGWQVWVSRGHMDHDHEEDNFCKAAAIALLKASGKIEVIE